MALLITLAAPKINMKPNRIYYIALILILVVFRIFLGIQINFSHLDYEQIYLIGLENALSDQWSFWGPDVVWSKTRLAGALQGLLVGLPLRLFGHPFAPIVLSNVISSTGLLLVAFYAKKRFPSLSLSFLILLVLLLPFYLYHGVVVLNTAYLLFSGALLFISVFELFLHREDLLLKNPNWYFFAIGFALLFTYQLHLTWVMFLPFILVLLYLEAKRKDNHWPVRLGSLILGAIISGSTLLPTILQYHDVIYSNAGGNMTFKAERLLQIFDVFIRYISFSTFDVTYNHDIYKHASEQSTMVFVLLRILKLLGIIQFVFLMVSYFKMRKNKAFQKVLLLFGLTLVMATFLYMLSNKHLSLRTYILLYPIPLWMSFYAYQYWKEKKWLNPSIYSALAITFITYIGVAYYNYNGAYSFHSVRNKIDQALESKNAEDFATRRETLMDNYN
jgi:hypothetical protein